MNYGVRSGGGIGEYLQKENFIQPLFLTRLGYDLSFFMIVVVILLNILFGIIVDTFKSIREKQQSDNADTLDKCFICGLPRQTFDR